jgi:7,8-dihydropterin-6-yl-methyl-4-(beta-D-ribofuranosyl)aminobenzene 5'-phosphate synthase
MQTPQPVDSIEIQILVDNVTDSLSTVPDFVETEWAGLGRRRRGTWVLSGSCMCCAAHGLSCLITVQHAGRKRTALFDSGPEDAVFEQNVTRLGVDLGPVEAIVLSHGHFDHAGAMLRALQIIRDRNGGRRVPYYAHPDAFRLRATKMPNGTMRPLEDVPAPETLAAYGAELISTREPQMLLDGMAYVSGEIPRVTAFEKGLPGQHRKTLDGSGWELDELVMDERFLAVNVANKGMVIFTACSHAGVINVLKHAKSTFPDVPLYTVVGGFHLTGSNERIIPNTVEAMREFDLAVIAPGHCTGWRAVNALANAFGDAKLAPLGVGKRYTF